jgi:protocatechuate 3,4-dioxygenase beta subunit
MDDSQATTAALTAPTGPGPYYIRDAPQLVDGLLNYTGLPGETIAVVGHVYAGPETSAPLSGAKVEIWQADASGNYHPSAGGEAGRFHAGELGLRGYVLSGEDGSYRFTTIYPGFYLGRTRHIHVRASAEGVGSVVTQIVVPPKPGDLATPEDDPIVRSLPKANRVTFVEQDGLPTATFDFHLAID